jgi:hypothetical protein
MRQAAKASITPATRRRFRDEWASAGSLAGSASRHQLVLQVGQGVVCFLEQGFNVLAQRFNGHAHLRAQEHRDVASVRQ